MFTAVFFLFLGCTANELLPNSSVRMDPNTVLVLWGTRSVLYETHEHESIEQMRGLPRRKPVSQQLILDTGIDNPICFWTRTREPGDSRAARN